MKSLGYMCLTGATVETEYGTRNTFTGAPLSVDPDPPSVRASA